MGWMPSLEHQALAMLLLENPPLLVWLLRHVLGLELPERVRVTPGPETVRALRRSDHYADGVSTITSVDDPNDREAFVIEVQLHEDDDKHYSWALYVGGTASRLRCPSTLVVVTTSPAVERWCSTPIDVGRGRMILRPLVLGPSNVPHDIDTATARAMPELAVFVAIVHRRGPGSKRTIGIAVDALATLARHDARRAELYLSLLSEIVEEDVLTMWNQQMKVDLERRLRKALEEKFYRLALEQGREESREEGQRQGRAEALQLVLETRGLVPTPTQRSVIDDCDDDTTMMQWLRDATHVDTIDTLLGST